MDIAIDVKNARAVGLKFDDLMAQTRENLLQRITALTGELESRVKSEEPVVTGQLREETLSKIYDDPNRISGRVFVSGHFAKAAALEYGAHKTARVRPHSARLDHVFDKRIAPMVVMISAHSRRLNIAERAYLRQPLASMSGEVIERLRAAVAASDEGTK